MMAKAATLMDKLTDSKEEVKIPEPEPIPDLPPCNIGTRILFWSLKDQKLISQAGVVVGHMPLDKGEHVLSVFAESGDYVSRRLAKQSAKPQARFFTKNE